MAKKPKCNLPDCANWDGEQCLVGAEAQMEVGTIGEKKKKRKARQQECRGIHAQNKASPEGQVTLALRSV